jgi:hypothetical protein
VHSRLLGIGVGFFALSTAPGCSYTPSVLEAWPEKPSCGRYENRNEPVSADQIRKNRCLLDAVAAGRPAQLIRTYATIEGDPITEYYRVLGPGRVELFIDSTPGQFGAQKWIHMVCEEVAEDADFVYGVSETCDEIPVNERVE